MGGMSSGEDNEALLDQAIKTGGWGEELLSKSKHLLFI